MKYPFLLIMVGFYSSFAQGDAALKMIDAEREEMQKSEMRRWENTQLLGTDAAQFSDATANFDIHYVRMSLFVDPAVRYIKGAVKYGFRMKEKSDSVILDLHNDLIVDSIFFRGTRISFGRTVNHGVRIRFPSVLEANTNDSFQIFYQGIPPINNSTGAFFKGAHSGTPIVWTLSEPYGAREWWPCKNNLTDKIDSLDIIISCPSQYQPSSNGSLISNTANGTVRQSYFRHRYPISSYLVAIAVTNYVINRDTVQVGTKTYDYLSFAYPENATAFFTNEKWSKQAYRLFSGIFGPYPFAAEKYGHTEWGWGGGMEHQTNSFQINTSSGLSAHELAHQWFGDKITCGSWKDIWLNEGFATYASVLFLESYNKSLFRGQLQSLINNITSAPDGSVYVDDTTSFNRIFNGRLSYNKGSYVLHMLRWKLGDTAFFRGIRSYLNDPKLSYGFALTDDLIRNMENASGKDLRPFFRDWVFGQGYPSYKATCIQNANNWIKIRLAQTTSHISVPFFAMPVELRLKGKSGEMRTTLEHATNDQEFWIDPGFAVDSVFIDPDLWILTNNKSATVSRSDAGINEIRLFPNPATNTAYVQISNPTDRLYEITLFNMIGQILYKTQRNAAGNDEMIQLPLRNHPKGMYLVKVSANGTERMVKKLLIR